MLSAQLCADRTLQILARKLEGQFQRQNNDISLLDLLLVFSDMAHNLKQHRSPPPHATDTTPRTGVQCRTYASTITLNGLIQKR